MGGSRIAIGSRMRVRPVAGCGFRRYRARSCSLFRLRPRLKCGHRPGNSPFRIIFSHELAPHMGSKDRAHRVDGRPIMESYIGPNQATLPCPKS